jgi:hypothetical protein
VVLGFHYLKIFEKASFLVAKSQKIIVSQLSSDENNSFGRLDGERSGKIALGMKPPSTLDPDADLKILNPGLIYVFRNFFMNAIFRSTKLKGEKAFF